MPSLQTIPGFNPNRTYRTGRHPKVTIYQVRSPYIFVTLPFAPAQVEYGDRSSEYVEIERPQDVPLLAFKRNRLQTLSFVVMLADQRDPGALSVEAKIDRLQKIARLAVDVHIVGYGPSISARNNYRCTDMSFTSMHREAGTNKILKAEVRLTFTQAPRLNNPIVPGMEKIYYEYRDPTNPSSRSTSTTTANGGKDVSPDMGLTTQSNNTKPGTYTKET